MGIRIRAAYIDPEKWSVDMPRSMSVVWNCNRGEACTNLKEPGRHGGDFGYRDAYRCLMGHDLPDLNIDFSAFLADQKLAKEQTHSDK
ncbi:MAG: hypothetical protein PHC88_05365 [Terrimicrobiaceae bacterium]|nr:hypothetical protein [Terrimicrobiaceae bacterium]